MNAVDILRYGHQFVLQSIDGIPEAKWEQPGVCGIWSVKDIVAHLASFEHLLVEILESFDQTEAASTPLVERFAADPQAFNDAEVARRHERSPRTVWNEYESRYQQTLTLLEQIDVARRRAPGALPWYGAAYDLEDFLVYSYYGHKREHGAQIAVFRDTLAAGADTEKEHATI